MPAPFAGPAASPLAPPRRLILATAFALGLAVSLAPQMPAAVAQESKAAKEETPGAAAPPAFIRTIAMAASPMRSGVAAALIP